MPDDVNRKRLRKKVLDRWENEGGRVGTDPAGADECARPCDAESEGNQLSGPQSNSTVGVPAPATENRKPTQM
jgi:hypothetical protein